MQVASANRGVRLSNGTMRRDYHAEWGSAGADIASFNMEESMHGDLLSSSHVLIGGISGGRQNVEIMAEGAARWQGWKQPGSAGFYPAGCRVKTVMSAGTNTILTLFMGAEATNDLLGAGTGLAWQTRPSAEDPFVSAALQRLAIAMRQGSDSLAALTAETLATALQLHVVTRFSDGRFPLGSSPEGLGRALDLIHAELPRSVSLARMAEAARMPRGRFLTAFRLRTGVSPHQYILRERLARAQALLETTRRPLHEIALEAGFANPGHLARTFRQRLDASPRAWRHNRDRS